MDAATPKPQRKPRAKPAVPAAEVVAAEPLGAQPPAPSSDVRKAVVTMREGVTLRWN